MCLHFILVHFICVSESADENENESDEDESYLVREDFDIQKKSFRSLKVIYIIKRFQLSFVVCVLTIYGKFIITLKLQ